MPPKIDSQFYFHNFDSTLNITSVKFLSRDVVMCILILHFLDKLRTYDNYA